MTVSPLTDDQQAELQAWRSEALITMPYFSRILFACRVVNAPGLGTFAVDKHYRMYIDFEAVKPKGPKWCAEALLHEASHLFADHATFAEDLGVTRATADAWNAAADCAINDDLLDAGCKSFDEDGMLPKHLGEPDYQTPHHYFAKIRQMQQQAQQNQPQPQQSGQQGQGGSGSQQQQQQQQNQCGTCGQQKPQQGSQGGNQQGGTQPGQGQGGQQGQGGSAQGGQQPNGQGQGGSGSQPGQGSGSGSGQPSQGQGGSAQGGSQPGSCGECGQQPKPFKGCGSGSGGQAAPWELPADDDLNGTAPAASSIEKEAVRVATAASVKDYVAKGRGLVPAGYVEIADKVLAPSKTPWQQVLASHIRRAVATKSGPFDTDRSRRNRRRHRQEVPSRSGGSRGVLVVPGTYTPEPRIEVIRDTSGSMSADDLAVVTREVTAIAKRIGIRGDNLVVTDVDAAVHQSQKFTGVKSIEKVAGRGGTSMTVGIEHAQQRRKDRPTVIVVITDGGTPWPTERGRIPVVAAIVPQQQLPQEFIDSMVESVPDFIKALVVDPAE